MTLVSRTQVSGGTRGQENLGQKQAIAGVTELCPRATPARLFMFEPRAKLVSISRCVVAVLHVSEQSRP